jgi:ribosome maturation protein Sdo1
MYISTHTPYTLQRESARTHTHTIFRERARAIFREREVTHTIFREGKRGKREREHNLRHVFHFVDERAGVVRPRERL